VDNLANQIATFVTSNGFDGVDIDFEDTNAFENAAGYDGVDFLTQLTDDLYSQLPQYQNIVTHAPQTPYWFPDQSYSYQYPHTLSFIGIRGARSHGLTTKPTTTA